MARPVLLGLDNPYSRSGRFALYTRPRGSAGYRLWKVLQMERPRMEETDYLRAFDRRNLFEDAIDSRLGEARVRFEQMEDELAGRTVVGLGKLIQYAMGLGEHEPCELVRTHGHSIILGAWIPHPSGKNRWYNDENNRRMVATFLTGLIQE